MFRNETLDATHLAEFHQIEGVVADYNLTLGHLMGILYEFFKKLGLTQSLKHCVSTYKTRELVESHAYCAYINYIHFLQNCPMVQTLAS